MRYGSVDSFFIVAPTVLGGLCLVHVLLHSALCSFMFCNHFDGEERVDCFTLVVFMISGLFITVAWFGLQCVTVVFPSF